MSFAQVQLLGNCGRDPEMSYTPNGIAVTKFSLAVSKKGKDTSGNTTESTVWYNCSAWRGLAEMINTHLKKGQMVFVQGELNARSYTTRDGKQGFSLDVTIDKFSFAGSKPQDTNGKGHDTPPDDVDALGDLENHPF